MSINAKHFTTTKAKNSKEHLCLTCKINNVPECMPDESIGIIAFGDGVGNDNVVECSNYKSKIVVETVKPIDEIDPDMVSKRTIINAYRGMRQHLSVTTIRLFFYAPDDAYFNNLSNEQRDSLTRAANVMFSNESDGEQAGKRDSSSPELDKA